MNFEDLLEQAQHGIGTDWLTKDQLLEFCDFALKSGFGIQLFEAVPSPTRKAKRYFAYEMIGVDGEKNWENHRDPARSMELVHEKLKLAEENDAELVYKVWIDVP